MKHLIKIPLQLSDLFVEALDRELKTITYSVRDKEKGLLMEPLRCSKWELIESDIHFDMRHISVMQAGAVWALLNDKVTPIYEPSVEVILPATRDTSADTKTATLSQLGNDTPSGSTENMSSVAPMADNSASPPAT